MSAPVLCRMVMLAPAARLFTARGELSTQESSRESESEAEEESAVLPPVAAVKLVMLDRSTEDGALAASTSDNSRGTVPVAEAAVCMRYQPEMLDRSPTVLVFRTVFMASSCCLREAMAVVTSQLVSRGVLVTVPLLLLLGKESSEAEASCTEATQFVLFTAPTAMPVVLLLLLLLLLTSLGLKTACRL